MSGRRADDGFTLVELVVYAMLFVVVLALAGTLVVRSLAVQRDARDVAGAIGSGQAAADSISRGVRNAAAVGPAAASGSNFLVARVSTGAAGAQTWVCRGWYYTSSGGGSLYTISRAATTGAAIVQPATAADLAGWTLLARPVTLTGSRLFTEISGTAPAQKVRFSYSTPAGDRRPVLIATEVATRKQSDTGSSPCF